MAASKHKAKHRGPALEFPKNFGTGGGRLTELLTTRTKRLTSAEYIDSILARRDEPTPTDESLKTTAELKEELRILTKKNEATERSIQPIISRLNDHSTSRPPHLLDMADRLLSGIYTVEDQLDGRFVKQSKQLEEQQEKLKKAAAQWQDEKTGLEAELERQTTELKDKYKAKVAETRRNLEAQNTAHTEALQTEKSKHADILKDERIKHGKTLEEEKSKHREALKTEKTKATGDAQRIQWDYQTRLEQQAKDFEEAAKKSSRQHEDKVTELERRLASLQLELDAAKASGKSNTSNFTINLLNTRLNENDTSISTLGNVIQAANARNKQLKDNILHAAAMQTRKSKDKGEVEDVSKDHEQEIVVLTTAYEAALERLTDDHKTAFGKLELKYRNAIRRVEQPHPGDEFVKIGRKLYNHFSAIFNTMEIGLPPEDDKHLQNWVARADLILATWKRHSASRLTDLEQLQELNMQLRASAKENDELNTQRRRVEEMLKLLGNDLEYCLKIIEQYDGNIKSLTEYRDLAMRYNNKLIRKNNEYFRSMELMAEMLGVEPPPR
ncbi:hypothetical protein FKW77_002293 [Venturia effusa]|uniref:Uncharacterized protein n=1 Tax=Venturia effusa TaxID=50376 RepID=A0A517LNH1_9PEZI|nr:hypothetical protein FKW77_002293 [Venturia effusa]